MIQKPVGQFSFNSVGISLSQFWEQTVKNPKYLIAFSCSLCDISYVTHMHMNFKWILAENKAKKKKKSGWILQKWKPSFPPETVECPNRQTPATWRSNFAYNNLSAPRMNDMLLYFTFSYIWYDHTLLPSLSLFPGAE